MDNELTSRLRDRLLEALSELQKGTTDRTARYRLQAEMEDLEGDTAHWDGARTDDPPASWMTGVPTYKPVPGSAYFGEVSRCWFATDSGDGEVIRAEPTLEQADSPDVWALTDDTVWGPE